MEATYLHLNNSFLIPTYLILVVLCIVIYIGYKLKMINTINSITKHRQLY